MRIYQFNNRPPAAVRCGNGNRICQIASEGDLNGWAVSPSNAAIISDGALKVTNPVRSENSRAEIVKSLPLGKVAGRRVWASVEMSQDLTPSVSKWGGKVFLLEGGMKGHYVYAGKYVAPGKSGWGKSVVFRRRSAGIRRAQNTPRRGIVLRKRNVQKPENRVLRHIRGIRQNRQRRIRRKGL